MSQNKRRRAPRKPTRHIWVFSELNDDLTPKDLARILTSAALEAQKRLKATATEKEGRDE